MSIVSTLETGNAFREAAKMLGALVYTTATQKHLIASSAGCLRKLQKHCDPRKLTGTYVD